MSTPKRPSLAIHQSDSSIRSKASFNKSLPPPTHSNSFLAPGETQTGYAKSKGKAKAGTLTEQTKVVWKGLLESPNHVRWPVYPRHLQQTVLHALCALMANVSEYNHSKSIYVSKRTAKSKKSLKKKPSLSKTVGPPEPAATDPGLKDVCMETEEEQEDQEQDLINSLPPKPPVLDHILLGINICTKHLSSPPPPAVVPTTDRPLAFLQPFLAQANSTPSEPASESKEYMAYLFVCLADISPPSIVGHIPQMCAAYNGRRKALGLEGAVTLVSLGAGAEAVLAAALGIRRCAVLGIKSTIAPSMISQLQTILPSSTYPPIHVPHLQPYFPLLPPTGGLIATQRSPMPTPPSAQPQPPPASAQLAPLRIKMLKTTAPKDMKKVKADRSKAVGERRIAGKARKADGPRKLKEFKKKVTSQTERCLSS